MGTPVTGSSGPCTGATDLVCTGALAQDFNLSAQWAWNVVAAGPGSYSIAATVSSSDSDPAPSNNSTTFAFRSPRPAVEAEAEVEGGRGGGGASVAASGVKVSPAHPKAGATVTASIGVTRGGSPVRVGHVTCAATAGSAKVPGRGQHGLGSASCAFKTSAAEKGRVLRGSVSVSAGGKSLRRSFSARLR